MAVKVLKYPDPKLHKQSEPATFKEAKKIIKKLRDAAAQQPVGTVLGFAAPQIGINKRVFLIFDEAFINPEITWIPKEGFKYHREACFSVEDKSQKGFLVARPYAVKLKWTDEEGNEREERFNGQKGQIILHEYNHLNGRLCNGAEEAPKA